MTSARTVCEALPTASCRLTGHAGLPRGFLAALRAGLAAFERWWLWGPRCARGLWGLRTKQWRVVPRGGDSGESEGA